MARKIDYASLFTLRKDGRYTAARVVNGKKMYLYDRDPERLYHRLEELKTAKPVPFRAVAEEWQTEREGLVSISTVVTTIAATRDVLDRFGDYPLSEITPTEIYSFLASLAAKQFCRPTVQVRFSILNMVFDYAIRQGYTDINPCASVSLPRGLKSSKRVLPTDEALDAVKHSLDKPFGLYAYLLLYTGLRRCEALALTYEDIDRKAGLIHVTKSLMQPFDTPMVKAPKTEAGVRDVVLLDNLAAVLPKQKTGIVFPGQDGNYMKESEFARLWRAYCKAIGHNITAHQLRHGYATILFEAGIPDKDAQDLLGHSNIAVTRDVYTHIRSARRAETAKRLNAFVNTDI